MAGNKFLNPLIKLALCIFGTSLLGYYVYESLSSGGSIDSIVAVRILVLIGFVYLLIQSARELTSK